MTAPNSQSASEQGADSTALVGAAQRVFKAAARLLVGRMAATTAIQLLKEAFVEEAREQIERDPKQPRVTRSALSLATGIDARHIAAMEKQPHTAPPQSSADAFITTIEQWAKNPEWTDPDGEPADLPIYGATASFQTLVRHVAGNNVTPQTVLQRLVEHGNVEYVEDGKSVRLINPYYVPVKQEEMIALETGSLSLIKLAGAINHNTHANGTNPLLQQDRWTNHVPTRMADEVSGELRKMLQGSIREVENYLEALEKEHEGSDEPKTRVGSGWFVFRDEIDPPTNSD